MNQRDLPSGTDIPKLARQLCRRRRDIGADGLIIIAGAAGYDFNMLYYNADGSGPAMCGNGARAAMLFAGETGLITGDESLFLAADGPHQGKLFDHNIAVTIRAARLQSLLTEKKMYLLDTGVQHLVWLLDNIAQPDFLSRATDLRRQYTSNVNGICKIDGEWHIRTFEKGVEAETLACGTGAAAAAWVLNRFFNEPFPITIKARGGTLVVSVSDQTWLAGPARIVFNGNF